MILNYHRNETQRTYTYMMCADVLLVVILFMIGFGQLMIWNELKEIRRKMNEK